MKLDLIQIKMNFHDKSFFRSLDVPEHIKTFYYMGKTFSRDELIELKNKILNGDLKK